MFAVIKTGGKQYKVAANDVLKIEKLEAEPGSIVTFDQVLMVGDEAGTTLGAPLVEGALVAAEFVGTKKQKTIIILKKHRRQHYDRRNGHRQLLSTVRITEILTGGAQPTIRPANDAVATAPTPSVTETSPAVADSAAPSAEAVSAVSAAVAESNGDAVTEAAAAKKPSRRKAAPKGTDQADQA